MPAIFRYAHVVTPADIDGQGHVNNLEYLRWMQHAAVEHSAAQGWDIARYREHDAGFVARSHTIEYLASAYEGDEVSVLTWVSDFQKVTSRRKYKVVRERDGAVLAVAETNWAFVTLSTGRPKRIPPDVSGAFEVVAEDASV